MFERARTFAATRRGVTAAGLAVVLLGLPLSAQIGEKVDYDAVMRIKDEGFGSSSRVMEFASWLTDVHGPRLTNSPQFRAAGQYVVKQMTGLGFANVKLEPWGPFGRGWSNEYTHVRVVAPYTTTLLAFSKAWTPGTNGPVKGEATLATLEKDEDLTKHKGQLKGKFVLLQPAGEVKPLFDAPGRRYDEGDLEKLTRETPTRGGMRGGGRPPQPGQPGPFGNMAAQMEFRRKRTAFLVAEGVAGTIVPSTCPRGDSGSVCVAAFSPGEGSRDPKEPTPLVQIVLASEHYGRLVRTLEKKLPVTIEADVRNTFHDDDQMSFNVVADLPGTDKADEVVMVGAHLDSWHTGTGATDNGASSAVVMEALRILKAAGLKPRRTIRMALWGGEEQGLLGSRAYVKDHFADRETMTLKPDHGKLAAYFNMDNGGGAFRGIYLQNNDAAASVIAAWMEPFRGLGMTTLAPGPTSGTDHLSFDAVGLPGFQFIQDPLEYSTRTHHTNQDVYERLIPDDLKQNAVIIAAFAYHAAMRDERLPRKPLPKASPMPRIPGITAGN
jgi:hypothetical protein